MRTIILFLTLCGLFLFANVALADGEAEVLEVAVTPGTDAPFKIRVQWTGKEGNASEAGKKLWLLVKPPNFGQQDISRVQSLATTALLSGKTIWVKQKEGSSQTITSVKLLAVRK